MIGLASVNHQVEPGSAAANHLEQENWVSVQFVCIQIWRFIKNHARRNRDFTENNFKYYQQISVEDIEKISSAGTFLNYH